MESSSLSSRIAVSMGDSPASLQPPNSLQRRMSSRNCMAIRPLSSSSSRIAPSWQSAIIRSGLLEEVVYDMHRFGQFIQVAVVARAGEDDQSSVRDSFLQKPPLFNR